jgi:hypothetical protein
MTYVSHLQAIFDDMRDCAAQMTADKDAFFRRFPLTPPTISLDDGRLIFVGQKSVLAIGEIARIYRENSAECQRAVPQKDMEELVSRAIGLIISASTISEATTFWIPTDAEAFWTSLREQIVQGRTELDYELTHVFGAWLVQSRMFLRP